ncbi:uncharacterized protein LOC110097473 [Dendrobium catenatum]|uniref:PAR1 protein n=1 Tax=Dendrobium catenatum TaxID=906689 RepID=A0A2I0X8T6_9ASPA|nr:uncharacterized protein LOC110097473 [Dendrobium catenatum]PKU84335.1 hypothetical protein MA16_Dca002848 [Dendrobium catenatum]
MASQMIPIALILSLSLSLLPSSLAVVICEELPLDLCAFSISTAGHRCILESYRAKDGGEQTKNQCKTSDVVVERVSDWIETDECVRACGVDRTAKGISSDALLDSQFTGKLCSSTCHESCPNIVDLYFNLAAAEGVFLPDLCHARRSSPHRSMVELLSSGAASGPVAAASAIADEVAPPPSA